MDNITILATNTMKEMYRGDGIFSLVMAVLFALCTLAFIYLIIKQIQYKEKVLQITLSVTMMVMAALGWYFHHTATHAILDEKRPVYTIEINDETRMKEFYDTYEVIETDEDGNYIVLPIEE